MPKLILIILILFLFASQSSAQTSIGEATRETNRPLRGIFKEEFPKLPEIPSLSKEEKTADQTGPKFIVSEIILEGAETFPLEEFQPILNHYLNKEITLSELQKATKEIEAKYLSLGVIAACIIPPQKLTSGKATLQIIESKMGELQINEHRWFKKSRLKKYWIPKKNETLRYQEMLRSLYTINKNPDRQVKSTLIAGKEPGTTDVKLDVTSKFPIHVTSSFDKEGSPSTGEKRFGHGVKHNNFLGHDDTLITGYLYGSDFSSVYAYHTMPLNKWGTSLVTGYNQSKSAPKKEFTDLLVRSQARNGSISLTQDIFQEQKFIGTASLTLDIKDKSTSTSTGTLNRDRLRILRAGFNYYYTGFGGVTSISPTLSQGLHALGARDKNEFTSRGAKSTSTKFNLDAQHQRLILNAFRTVLRFKSQVASNKLTPQEQFYLGGINSVRGYPSGDFAGDHGIESGIEILIPAFIIPHNLKMPYMKKNLRDYLTFVMFYDYGWGKKRDPESTERDDATLMGVGGGLRIGLFDKATARLEWAAPIGDRTITEEGTSRFHIAIDFEF